MGGIVNHHVYVPSGCLDFPLFLIFWLMNIHFCFECSLRSWMKLCTGLHSDRKCKKKKTVTPQIDLDFAFLIFFIFKGHTHMLTETWRHNGSLLVSVCGLSTFGLPIKKAFFPPSLKPLRHPKHHFSDPDLIHGSANGCSGALMLFYPG